MDAADRLDTAAFFAICEDGTIYALTEMDFRSVKMAPVSRDFVMRALGLVPVPESRYPTSQ